MATCKGGVQKHYFQLFETLPHAVIALICFQQLKKSKCLSCFQDLEDEASFEINGIVEIVFNNGGVYRITAGLLRTRSSRCEAGW